MNMCKSKYAFHLAGRYNIQMGVLGQKIPLSMTGDRRSET